MYENEPEEAKIINCMVAKFESVLPIFDKKKDTMTDEKPSALPLRIGSPSQEVESPQKDPREKEEPEYVLKWSEHNIQLIAVFQQLWEDNVFTDVTLTTESKSFQAHKLILSACSPYFRALFMDNPCKHPIVFLKDISEDHMGLLLEYMYRGSISVKQDCLSEILKTASTLHIRGLTTAEAPISESADTPRPLIVDELYHCSDSTSDKFQHVETGSCHSTTSGRSGFTYKKAEGRKSSMPKRLRLSGDRDSDISSPGYPISLQETEQLTSPDHGVERINHRLPSDDNIAVSEEEEAEIEVDQPVDFSKTKLDSALQASRFSILGSYLKSGRPGESPDDDRHIDSLPKTELSEDLRRSGLTGSWLEPLANLARSAPRPASRDSRGDSREDRDTSGEENISEEKDCKDYPQISLSDSLGIDIANKLRSHFLANLPTQSYAWLNGMNGVAPPSLPASNYSSWLNGMNERTPRSQSSSMLDGVKLEKNPLGGIRTGEIGANGKPAVKCEICGKKLADPSSLYRHRKIHSGDKPHKCPYCERRFIQRYNMKQHIKTHRIELLADQKNGFHHDLSVKGNGMSPLHLASYQEQDHGLDMSN